MRRSLVAPALGLAVVLAGGRAVAPGPAPQPRHHRLAIRNLAFEPADLRVVPGDTLSWFNHDVVPHTVTASGAGWDSGEIAPGAGFVLVAEHPDTVVYRCRYHPTMTATLEIR